MGLTLRQYWNLLADYLRPQRTRVLWLGVLLLASIGLQLANPQLVRVIVDGAETGSPLNRLVGAAGLFIIVALMQKGVALVAVYIGELVSWTASNALRADLALHCLELDLAFHKAHPPGELIERVDGDVNLLANFFSQLFLRLLGNLILLAGVVVLLWLLNPWAGLVMTLAVGGGIPALRWLNRRIVPRWEAVRTAVATQFGALEEWLNGLAALRSAAGEPYVMRRFFALARRRWQATMAAMRLLVFVSGTPTMVFALAYAGAHLVGASLTAAGTASIGTIYVFFYYIDVIKSPTWEINRQLDDLQRASASIGRIQALLAQKPAIEQRKAARPAVDGPANRVSARRPSDAIRPVTVTHRVLPSGPLGIAFDGVHFHYADEPGAPVLEDLSFRLEPGQILGLLGRTGSGKSTLTRLLLRLYDPVAGTIRLGRGPDPWPDLRRLELSALRQAVGLVTQEVQLFRASLRDNLTLFDDTVPDDRLLAVLAELELTAWLERLPAGLDSRLEGDSGLSAGEAQLLAFARVFLTDPALVILDEASSRLDPGTEQRIERAVERLLSGRTAIIIAHRLSTVLRADTILILSQGRVAELGARQRLMADTDSHFSRLLQAGDLSYLDATPNDGREARS